MADRSVIDGRASLLVEFANGIAAYLSMIERREPSGAPELLERLAESWRLIAEQQKLEQLEDGLLEDEAVQLLCALEDSLLLRRSRDEARRAMALEPAELTARAYAIGRKGAFGDAWLEQVERALSDAGVDAGGAETLADRALRGRPRGYGPRPGRKQRMARGNQMSELLEQGTGDALTFYRDLAPDGRDPDETSHASIADQLETIAAIERVIDLERYTFSDPDWTRLGLELGVLRSVRRSLTLAGSADPARRALAMPFAELQARAFIARERLDGLSYDQAFERLTEAMAAQSRNGSG